MRFRGRGSGPGVSGAGIDPVRFGIIVVFAVELAQVMPPMGIDVFVTRELATDGSPAPAFPGVLPFCAASAA